MQVGQCTSTAALIVNVGRSRYVLFLPNSRYAIRNPIRKPQTLACCGSDCCLYLAFGACTCMR